jgi:hypothetical protein
MKGDQTAVQTKKIFPQTPLTNKAKIGGITHDARIGLVHGVDLLTGGM